MSVAATLARTPFPLSPPREGQGEGCLPQRLHALDHLRAFAMFLGVVIHAVIPFITLPEADAWPSRNADQRVGFDLVAGLIHAFRMQLFFLLCGFFARLVHQRVGTLGFLKHRLLRVGLPFAVSMITIGPLVHWLWGFRLNAGATMHLWFLEYLLIYSLAAALIAPWPPGKRFDPWIRKLLATAWKPLLLAIPTALLMLWSPIWDETKNPRGITFAPNALALVYYSLFYLFGWGMHRHADLLPRFRRGAAWQFGLGFVALIAWGLIHQSSNDAMKGNFLYYIIGSSIAWLFSFAFIGLFLKHFDRPSKPGRYLADSAYWVYLAHLPLVIALQQWIVPSSLNPWIEFALINAIALPILLLTYEWCVRYTVIGQVLNGRKDRRPVN